MLGGSVLLYTSERALAVQSYQHWISSEFLSLGWFVTVFVLLAFYITWWCLVDKRRLSQLLLIGSYAAVWYVLTDMLFCGLYGLAEYKIRLLPLMPDIFVVSVTKIPIVIMLVMQYTSSWKSYFLWSCLGIGVLVFALLPIYTAIGIFALHVMNYFDVFLICYSGVITSWVGYKCTLLIQRRHSQLKPVSTR